MPSPPRRATFPLYLTVVGDDHPRACTGRRLLATGLARPLPGGPRSGRGPVLLDPYASVPLSNEDRPRAEGSGLLAVDCSWNRLSDASGFPIALPRGLSRRRLPMLLAANPQHYGRLGELNTAEALAAALEILGESESARELLSGFAGGPEFFVLNRDPLRAFRSAAGAEGIRGAERAAYGPPGSSNS